MPVISLTLCMAYGSYCYLFLYKETLWNILYISLQQLYLNIRRRGVVGRVPAFQPGAPGSIPGGVRNLISVLGLGVCPLSVFCPVLSSAEALALC